jgi:hypothetical protein
MVLRYMTPCSFISTYFFLDAPATFMFRVPNYHSAYADKKLISGNNIRVIYYLFIYLRADSTYQWSLMKKAQVEGDNDK